MSMSDLDQDDTPSTELSERTSRRERREALKQMQIASRDARSAIYALVDVMYADIKKFHEEIIEQATIVLTGVDHNDVPVNASDLLKDLEQLETDNLKTKDELDRLRKT